MKTLFALIVILSGFFPLQAREWEKLENCRLVKNEYANGDSIPFNYKGEEMIIRLYFVDCLQSDDSQADTVAAEAYHFGKTDKEIICVGKYATTVTNRLLAHHFTVLTKRLVVSGAGSTPRYYGFVITAKGEDLGEVLVKNGLARSHGTQAVLPEMSGTDLRSKYDSLEESAKVQKIGIYSPHPLQVIAKGKSNVDVLALPTPTPSATPTPLKVVVVPSLAPVVTSPITPKPMAVPATAAASDLSVEKININTAPQAEIETLPGIGRAIAERIIESRPFQSVEGLKNVKGIGPAKFTAIANKVSCK